MTLVACGKKGPARRSGARLPLPASALHAHIDEEAVVVGWTIPRTRADGSALRDLSSVRLYRREEEDGRRPRRRCCPRVASSATTRSPSYASTPPRPPSCGAIAMEWVDRRGLAPGRRYVYVVTATDAQGRISAPSERLPIPYLAAPRPRAASAPLPETAGSPSAGMPPAELLDGTPVAGLACLRRAERRAGARERSRWSRPGV